MNPIHQSIIKVQPGNHFSYVQDGHTDKGDAICPPFKRAGHTKKTPQKTQKKHTHLLAEFLLKHGVP